MSIIMRTASVLFSTSSMLLASSVLCAEPPRLTGATAQSTTTPSAGATDAPPLSAPAATSPSSTPNSGEPAAPPAAAKTSAPDIQTSGASVAASPYGSPNPPPSSSSSVTPPPSQKDTYDGPPTLLDLSKDYAIGGFGGVPVTYTRFMGSNAAQLCIDGGVIIDHVLTFGAGFCGVTSTVSAENYGPAPHYPNDRMNFVYGGAIIRYHLFSHQPVNLGVGALIGAGDLSIGVPEGSGEGHNYTHVRSEAVFVLEPQVGAYANVTRWLRLGAIVGYRIVSSVDTQGVDASDLCAPTLGGTIQGGWF